MRSIYSLGLLASFLFISGEALPCGGAFGTNFTIQPAQKIVVSVHDGIETYIFNPSFCGTASAFGLILPVPTTLKATPSLSSSQLYTDLTGLTAPTIVTTQQCQGRGMGGAASTGAVGNGTTPGAVVVQAGHVGIFDWTLLKANSVASFTDWLTANGYPYQASATNTFQPYVSNGWYFVAFKVSSKGASGAAGAPNSGSSVAPNTQICGDFGPVSLSFAASIPVIPAGIAAVSSSSLRWDIYAIAAEQQRLQSVSTSLQFSGTVGAPELSKYPSLASVAKPGDRVTEMLLSQVPSADLVLEADPAQADYRRTEYQVQYVACTGGASSGGGSSTSTVSNRGGAGPVAAGGAPSGGSFASSTPISSSATTGGVASSTPLSSATGGQLGIGGSENVATGGTLSGSAAPRTQPVDDQTGGSTNSNIGSGASTSRGGSVSVGSAPATGGSNVVTVPTTSSHDDSDHGGCAIVAPSSYNRASQAGLLAMAVAVLCGRRLRRRRFAA